jgi:hypothetical protein
VCLNYSALNAAYKKAIREQKLALEISAAKRERDFYLKKVDQSRALSSIEERMKKVTSYCYRFIFPGTTIYGAVLRYFGIAQVINLMHLFKELNLAFRSLCRDFNTQVPSRPV